MYSFIKYKRFHKYIKPTSIQDFFDELITDGWIIIHYEERLINNHMEIIVVCGKIKTS